MTVFFKLFVFTGIRVGYYESSYSFLEDDNLRFTPHPRTAVSPEDSLARLFLRFPILFQSFQDRLSLTKSSAENVATKKHQKSIQCTLRFRLMRESNSISFV